MTHRSLFHSQFFDIQSIFLTPIDITEFQSSPLLQPTPFNFPYSHGPLLHSNSFPTSMHTDRKKKANSAFQCLLKHAKYAVVYQT